MNLENAIAGFMVGLCGTMIVGLVGMYGFAYHQGSAEWRTKLALVEARDPVLVFAKKCSARGGWTIIHEREEPIGYVCRIEGEIKP